MANFGLRDVPIERDQALKVLHQRIEQYRNAPQNERGNNLFWISQGVRPGVGYFYALTPVYMANRLQADARRGADHPYGELLHARQFADERDDF